VDGLGLIPDRSTATIPSEGVSWNDTTFLTIGFLALAAALLLRFLRTGGRGMLAMMGGSPEREHHHTAPDPRPEKGAGG